MKIWFMVLAFIVTPSMAYAQNEIPTIGSSSVPVAREGYLYGLADALSALADVTVDDGADGVYFARELQLRSRYIRTLVGHVEFFRNGAHPALVPILTDAAEKMRRAIIFQAATLEGFESSPSNVALQSRRLREAAAELEAAAQSGLSMLLESQELGYLIGLRLGLLASTDLGLVGDIGRGHGQRLFSMRQALAENFAMRLRDHWALQQRHRPDLAGALDRGARSLRNRADLTEAESAGPIVWSAAAAHQMKNFKIALHELAPFLPVENLPKIKTCAQEI